MEAHRWTGVPEFRAAAMGALAFERSLMTDDGWPDLRSAAEASARPAPGWCHGPSGIAIARARILSIEDLPEVRDDLARAVALTRRIDVDLGSYCCGMAGVDDALVWLGGVLDDAALVAQGRGQVATRWASGATPPLHPRLDPNARTIVPVPNLMRGIAGVLLGVLRALPGGERLPCPLSLT